MKKILLGFFKVSAFTVLALLFIALPKNAFASDPTLGSNQTIANAGVNDQTDTTITTVSNIAQVKATRTLTVSTLPVTTNTFTIGTCVVTFATTTGGSPAEDTDCNGGARILTTTGTSADIARTRAQIATALISMTNATSTDHGNLSITSSTTDSTSVVFMTAGTEIAATSIAFSDGTSGKITSPSYANITGVVPVAQINTVSVGGSVEPGDIYTINVPAGVVTYTVTTNDTSSSTIATAINAALQATSTYAAAAYTTSANFGTVVFTAKTAGTGFTQSSGTTNVAAASQTVVFTPANTGSNLTHTYTVTINGHAHTYTSIGFNTIAQVVSGLNSALANDADVTCSQDGTAVTCSAKVAATAFTYSTSVNLVVSNGGVSSGGGGGNRRSYNTNTTYTITPVSLGATVSSSVSSGQFTRLLRQGIKGADVTALQNALTKAGLYTGPITGYFGALTKAAVIAYQIKLGIIVNASVAGAGTVGPITRAKLNTQ